MDSINEKWSVAPCPCGSSFCKSALIEPHIVNLQGAIDRDVAKHVVALHNSWLDWSNCNLREVENPMDTLHKCMFCKSYSTSTTKCSRGHKVTDARTQICDEFRYVA